MIGAILIIISLILAFFEKAEKLFKKPVTIGKISIISLLLISATISIFSEHQKDDLTKRDSKVIDSLSGGTKILYGQIDTLRKDSKISQREYEDSLINYHNYTTLLLAKYGLKVDTLTHTIHAFDTSISKEILPTLTLLSPPFFKKYGTENVIAYDLYSLNADAHILNYSYVLLNTKNLYGYDYVHKNVGNSFIDTPRVCLASTFNFTSVIPATNSMTNLGWATNEMYFFLDRDKKEMSISDTFIFVIEYWYKSKGNRRQVPLRKIYVVYQEKMLVEEADSYLFSRVAFILKKYKIWRKFYDL